MIKDYFEVPDIEHDGDIEHFKGIIQDAGGIVTGHSWSGDDGDSCYIFYRCSNQDECKICNGGVFMIFQDVGALAVLAMFVYVVWRIKTECHK